MDLQNKILEEIRRRMEGHFESHLIERFKEAFLNLTSDTSVTDYFIFSKEAKLGLGFFDREMVSDITLQNGEIYLTSFPLNAVKKVRVDDLGNKFVLKILGEEKLDYEVPKTQSLEAMERYEKKLRACLGIP